MASSERGSYRIGEAGFRDTAAELARLKLQAELAWPQELNALERHGLRVDSDVLEAGCGPGFVTVRLLDHVRNGTVTALDVDSTMLEHARALVGEPERVRFVERSVTATELPDRAFDVVVARFLLQHVPDVGAALAEFRRVLRPDGRLIVVEGDSAFSVLFDPDPPFTGELLAGVERAQRAQGGNSKLGRRVPRLLDDAAYAHILIDVVVAHSVLVGRDAIRNVVPVQALDHMEAVGAISPELAKEARDYVARVGEGEESFDGLSCYFVVSGSA